MEKELKNIKKSFLRLNDKIFSCYFTWSEEREELVYSLRRCKTYEEVYKKGEELLTYLKSMEDDFTRENFADAYMWLHRWEKKN